MARLHGGEPRREVRVLDYYVQQLVGHAEETDAALLEQALRLGVIGVTPALPRGCEGLLYFFHPARILASAGLHGTFARSRRPLPARAGVPRAAQWAMARWVKSAARPKRVFAAARRPVHRGTPHLIYSSSETPFFRRFLPFCR